MDKTKTPKENVIPFLRDFNDISPWDLDNILESLEDMGYLSKKGKEFRKVFWETFIKE